MANRFNRSVRNVRDIEKFPFFTNEINDLIHTVDDKTYIRLNRKYERITGLEELEKTFYGFKKQIERKTDNTNKKLNEYMKNNDEVIYNLTKEHNNRLIKLNNTLTGFKKQMETKTDNTQTKINDYITNNDEVIENLTREHNNRLTKLENGNTSDSDLEETFVTREEFEEFQTNINNRVNEMFKQIQIDMQQLRGEEVNNNEEGE